MTGNLQFQYPWLLALLALLPIYAFLRGRIGKLAALRFPSADIARAAGGAARAAAGRLLLFLRLLTVALASWRWPGPASPTTTPRRRPAALTSCSCSTCPGP